MADAASANGAEGKKDARPATHSPGRTGSTSRSGPPYPWLVEEGSGDGHSVIPPPVTWMAENKCFSQEHYTATTEKAATRIKAMASRWSRAVDIFLFLLPGNNDASFVAEVKSNWYERLVSMHSVPTRHYHTLVHLDEMFGVLDLLLEKTPYSWDDMSADALLQNSAVRAMQEAVAAMATFFHDAIYDAVSSTNEEDSADLFKGFAAELKSGRTGSTPPEDVLCSLFDLAVDTVVGYILATKSHAASADAAAGHNNGNDASGTLKNLQRYLSKNLSEFLDADMSVLAKDNSAYCVYAGLIRKEYIHVPREVYCEKRAEVLQSFLEGSDGEARDIFRTAKMRGWFEQQARHNLMEEVALLKSGVIPCEHGEVAENAPAVVAAATADEKLEEVAAGLGQCMDTEAESHLTVLAENEISSDEQIKEVIAPGWGVLTDPASGREYYYNAQTGETAWEKPLMKQEAPDTVDALKTSEVAGVLTDDQSGVVPAVSAAAPEQNPETEVSEEAASTRQSPEENVVAEEESQQGGTEVFETTEETETVPVKDETPALAPGWVVQYNEDGRPYYFSEIEQRSSWTFPSAERHDEGDVAEAKPEDDILPCNDTEPPSLARLAAVSTESDPIEAVDFIDHALPAADSIATQDDVLSHEVEPASDANPAPLLPDGWVEVTDEFSGRVYYYNESEGTTSWDPPAARAATDAHVNGGGVSTPEQDGTEEGIASTGPTLLVENHSEPPTETVPANDGEEPVSTSDDASAERKSIDSMPGDAFATFGGPKSA